ncbi:MAG TPA: pyridoxamine 5'-phosphate oxidase [Gemmataceae bacterium]|nr:pyridoxamine 5'-phosphate oxidase [Gemmataceae bacterium]
MTQNLVFPEPDGSPPERGLCEDDVDRNPFKQFTAWLDQALAAKLPQPLGMALATSTRDGRPSVRMVLLRGVSEKGFCFFTNYDSRKAEDLYLNPRAALVLYWAELDRQVRIEGKVERVSAEESDAYFGTRPRGSQLGAWASPQSQVIPNRDVLDERLRQLIEQYGDEPIPRPPNWGGFRVVPDAIEFWEGGDNRLHDRLRYLRQEDGSWRIERLAP